MYSIWLKYYNISYYKRKICYLKILLRQENIFFLNDEKQNKDNIIINLYKKFFFSRRSYITLDDNIINYYYFTKNVYYEYKVKKRFIICLPERVFHDYNKIINIIIPTQCYFESKYEFIRYIFDVIHRFFFCFFFVLISTNIIWVQSNVCSVGRTKSKRPIDNINNVVRTFRPIVRLLCLCESYSVLIYLITRTSFIRIICFLLSLYCRRVPVFTTCIVRDYYDRMSLLKIS